MRIRSLIQAILGRFGYQLVRSSVRNVATGPSHDESATDPEALQMLEAQRPQLDDLRRRYAATRLPMTAHTWWTNDYIARDIDLTRFRGDNAYVWQTRHMKGTPEHRYYLYALDVAARDHLGLLQRLKEDGAFGCWTWTYQRFPRISRDLLDSVNELNFLHRHAGIGDIPGLRLLDIGAGYGRLAHRADEGLPNLETYYCCDAVAESTFLSRFYLRFRQVVKARIVAIDELEQLASARPHLAINVHSFSEMSYAAIAGWLDLIQRLGAKWLFVVPNDGGAFLSVESGGKRRDFRDAIEARGYRLAAHEYTIQDPDLRRLAGVSDMMFLFERNDGASR